MSFKIDKDEASKLEKARKAAKRAEIEALVDDPETETMAFNVQELMRSDVGRMATKAIDVVFDHIEEMVLKSFLADHGYESLHDVNSTKHKREYIQFKTQAALAISAACGFEVAGRNFGSYPDDLWEYNSRTCTHAYTEGLDAGRSYEQFKDNIKDVVDNSELSKIVDEAKAKFGEDPESFDDERREKAAEFVLNKIREAANG